MATYTGGYDINSLLAVKTGITVAELDQDQLAASINAEIEAHNNLTQDMLSVLAETTVERIGAWGNTMRGEMIEVDEYGRAPTQNQGQPGRLAWPLRKFQHNIGWTNDFFLQATPADLALVFNAARRADALGIRRGLREAVFNPINRTVRDVFVDKTELTVRALVNADGEPIPAGPNGEEFDPNAHTHYNVTSGSTLAESDVEALISHVVEHGHGTGLTIYINQAQEAAVRGLDGFAPYVDARIIPAMDSTVGRAPLDVTRVDNRAIGLIAGAEVLVKPWIPSGYLFAFAAGDPSKPLRMRLHDVPAMQGLRLAAQFRDYPLHADIMENYYGFGAYARTNGAVLQITSGSTYTAP